MSAGRGTRETGLTARALLPLISGLGELGCEPGPLLAAVGLNPAMLEDPDARVPSNAGVQLLERAALVTGDDCIALHLAERADLRTVDVHFYAMLASASLRDAYARMSRYQRLIHGTNRVELAADPRGPILRHVRPGGLSVPRHAAEFIVGAWVRAGRLATGTDWTPAEVRFADPAPADVREHARFFRAPVVFATGENAVVLSESVLALPCVGEDPGLVSLIDRHARERLRSLPSTTSIAERTRAVIQDSFRDGEPSASGTAARLKMSVRTLNRTLASEATSYRTLVDQVRHETAARHLADRRISIGEVAFLIGFSELSAFHRAFKRWTVQTPAEFRKQTARPKPHEG